MKQPALFGKKLTKNQLSAGLVLLFLLIALPLYIFVLQTKRFDIRNRADTGIESNCFAVDKVIYVAPPESDASTCHDIQMAIDLVDDVGYTIKILPGTYTIANNPTHFAALEITEKSQLTIEGSTNPIGRQDVVLDFGTTSGGISTSFSDQITLRWLTLKGHSYNGMVIADVADDFTLENAAVYDTNASAIQIRNSNVPTINGVYVKSSAIALDIRSSSSFQFVNNDLFGSTHGIYTSDSTGEITSNKIAANREAGVAINRPESIVLEGNTIAENKSTTPGYGTGVKITNILNSLNTSIVLQKNIIALNTIGISIQNFSALDNFIFQSNDIWNNTTNFQGFFPEMSTNISEDPLFGQLFVEDQFGPLTFINSESYCIGFDSPVVFGEVSLGEYMGSRLYCSIITSPLPSTSLIPSASPGIPTTLRYKVKFQGVNSNKPPKFVELTFKQGTTAVSTISAMATADDTGIFTSSFISTDLLGGIYDVLIKGPAHLTKKFTNVELIPEVYDLDFTASPLLPGDIVDNERVDIFDYAAFVRDFGPRMPTSGSNADLDFDGDVDIFDYSLLVYNFNKNGEQ